MWDVLTDRQNLSGSMDLESLSPEVPKGSEQKQCPCLSQLFKASPRLLLELPPERSVSPGESYH